MGEGTQRNSGTTVQSGDATYDLDSAQALLLI